MEQNCATAGRAEDAYMLWSRKTISIIGNTSHIYTNNQQLEKKEINSSIGKI